MRQTLASELGPNHVAVEERFQKLDEHDQKVVTICILLVCTASDWIVNETTADVATGRDPALAVAVVTATAEKHN